jgi:hypothetical protein
MTDQEGRKQNKKRSKQAKEGSKWPDNGEKDRLSDTIFQQQAGGNDTPLGRLQGVQAF